MSLPSEANDRPVAREFPVRFDFRSQTVRASDAVVAAEPQGHVHTILLVDDEEKVISALRRLFRREGYDIRHATSGPDALRILEEHPVQLVISDHRMPQMSGIDLLRQIRLRWPGTLRIILSGYSDVNTIITAINEGEIYKFISKPWNEEELKLHVRRALEQQELQAENRRMAREIDAHNERLRELNNVLQQLADDAHTGLSSTQTLLEAVGVAVFTVDRSGLVVTANRRANALLAADLVGMPARTVLPTELCHLLWDAGQQTRDNETRFCREGRWLQCRVSPLDAADGCRGKVVTIWEEVR